jgi:hypothetical protein
VGLDSRPVILGSDGQWSAQRIEATGYPTLAMCREARADEIKDDGGTTARRQYLIGKCHKSPGEAEECPACGIGSYSDGCYSPKKPPECNEDGIGFKNSAALRSPSISSGSSDP